MKIPFENNFNQTVFNSNVPFDLFSFSFDQINSLKNLIRLEQISEQSSSKFCKVCNEGYGSFRSMRLHQGNTHFKIIKQYRQQYGKNF